MESPDGGYVISGNNSSNFDDDYVVKFKDAPSQTVDYTTVEHEHVYYFGPEELTIGPSFTVASTAFVDLVARDLITITGEFEADLGSELEAVVTDFVGIEPSLLQAGSGVSVFGLPARREDHTSRNNPGGVRLNPNYPNPFNPTTKIHFSIPHRQHVSLSVFNALGQEVDRVLDEMMDAGVHEASFDASGLPSGTYFYRLQAGQFVRTASMTVVK